VKPSLGLDGFEAPEESVPRARDEDNYKEWVDAITGEVERGQSDFAYAGPFSETVILGSLAQRMPGKTLQWNAEEMTVEGHPELDSLVRRDYRDGWQVEV